MWTLQSLPREYCRMRSGTTFVGSVNIFHSWRTRRIEVSHLSEEITCGVSNLLFSLAPTVHALFQEIDFSLSTCSFPLVLSRFCLQKSVMHVQSCCFANQSKPEAVICFCLNLLLFCRSRCRHRRHCLTLITPTPPTKHRVKKKALWMWTVRPPSFS